MTGLTFDTGALIALERGNKRMREVLATATLDGRVITVPSAVLIEWWRGTSRQAAILDSVDVEPLSEQVAKLAGLALEAVGASGGEGPSSIDAAVMASAAQRGDVVYTSDIDDLERLRGYFKAVTRVLRA